MGKETVWQGKYLTVVTDDGWEFAERAGDIEAAVIAAVDDEGHLLLIEQHRVPAGRTCLELPAGLVGDEGAAEAAEDAARRELEEERAIAAPRWSRSAAFIRRRA